uniref:Transposase (Putative), gypsy type n=1 Tax=Tanacetum cinerariifolium TaxID=118510 RepID=A0A699H1E2_TANCI|nr:hypothetical protein [Tanacetum cinerariifolium]
MMSELPDDVVGVYHRVFDFSGVRIPFSSFLLALIKHFKTLCKQGHWFSFSKRHAPSPVCIDDNHSCMKHWKSGFFLIDQRAIPDYMSWRHPDSAINDPTPPDVMGVYDFLCLLEWTSDEVLEKPHHDIRPTLQRLPFYCTPPAATDVLILELTFEDLVTSNPSAKIVAKAEASQNTTRPNIFTDDSSAECNDDDDSCDEILLVTLICSATMIPSSENQGGGFAALAAEGLNTRDSHRKGIMNDDDVVPDVFGDAIHREFFPFFPGHCYATYPEGGIFGNYKFTHEEWDAPHQPTLTVLTNERQVTRLNDKLFASDAAFTKFKAKGNERKKKIKSFTKSLDNLHAEVARRSVDLNRATILEAERDEEILHLKVELLSLAASARFEHGLSMHWTKEEFVVVLRKISQFMHGARGSERVSSSASDVVVALSVGEKGDGFVPSSIIDEEAAATPFGI